MREIFFTVIVASLNAAETIKATVDSILYQRGGDFEIIVKDGLSDDGTLSLLPLDERIRVFSQRDASVYDAMNQAIVHAKGKYLIFMNCGDRFPAPDVLMRARQFIEAEQDPGMDVFYGDYCKDHRTFAQNPHADRKHFLKEGFCHQSVFFNRLLFERFGNYNTAFRICADYEIMVRFFVNGATFHHMRIPVCDYQGGGISEREENLPRVRLEGNMVRKLYFTSGERLQYLCGKIKQHLNVNSMIKNSRVVQKLYALYSRLFGGNRFRGTRGNLVRIEGILHHVDINIKGTCNKVFVRRPRDINNFHVFINGKDNSIEIDENCLIKDLTLWIEDDNNRIRIGKDTLFCGICQLSCIEGTEISIGERCMFSSGINIRTGDSHSILDSDGKRINPSQDIHIGNHVWVGQNVTVLKNSEIPNNSVCGTGTIITKKFDGAGLILSGIPGKIVKDNINWCFERL